jgi:RNA polymerase sigma-70 factor (ECF subfamily)
MARGCCTRSPTRSRARLRSRMDAADDAALARRVVAGERDAEAELCKRLLPRVRAWGLKHLRDETAALDLGQHVVIAVLEALRAGRVIEIDRLGAYVLGTCKHVLAAWRRGERRRADLLDRYGPALADVARPPEPIDRARLSGCLDKLAPRARTVLALAFFAERSADEIANELGVSAGNVRVLRHRALAQLHTCMEGAS